MKWQSSAISLLCGSAQLVVCRLRRCMCEWVCVFVNEPTKWLSSVLELKFIKPKQISRPGPTFTFFSHLLLSIYYVASEIGNKKLLRSLCLSISFYPSTIRSVGKFESLPIYTWYLFLCHNRHNNIDIDNFCGLVFKWISTWHCYG